MTKAQSSRFLRTIAGFFFLILFTGTGIYAAINYSEYFPNGSTVLQSQTNGWTAPAGSIKDIATPEWCKTITSTLTGTIFVPTGSVGEWNAFKTNKPGAISIADCYVPPPMPMWQYTGYVWNAGELGLVANWGNPNTCLYTTRQNLTDGWPAQSTPSPYYGLTGESGCYNPAYAYHY